MEFVRELHSPSRKVPKRGLLRLASLNQAALTVNSVKSFSNIFPWINKNVVLYLVCRCTEEHSIFHLVSSIYLATIFQLPHYICNSKGLDIGLFSSHLQLTFHFIGLIYDLIIHKTLTGERCVLLFFTIIIALFSSCGFTVCWLDGLICLGLRRVIGFFLLAF